MRNPDLSSKEAKWSWKKALSEGLIDEDDTSVLFQSWNLLKTYTDHLVNAFSHPKSLHAIAIKTQPHPKVLERIVKWGFGLEAASMEEVKKAIDAGISPDKIVFDSPVKTKREISYCHENLKGLRLNVNSLEELNRIPKNPNFQLGIRINPQVETGAPEVYDVSHDESKFGVPVSEKDSIIDAIIRFPVTLLHIHSGSQMANIDSAISAICLLRDIALEANSKLELEGSSRRIETLDIGGGLIPEELIPGETSKMQEYVSNLRIRCPELWEFELITEFGQWNYFYTGYAISKIEYSILKGRKYITYIHIGADFLLRDSYVKPRGISFEALDSNANSKTTEDVTHDIAGPLCFAGDYLAKNIDLPQVEEGDLLLLSGTGSNSYGLWSRHCSRAIPSFFGVDFKNKKIEKLSSRLNLFNEI
ncbi:MAG: Diaminopimelate decarboxylase [Owenweeksia sp. TMED14]|nr:MAG: Diaminopimelate decarboxylase [Owenweeksia sp. TMED14]